MLFKKKTRENIRLFLDVRSALLVKNLCIYTIRGIGNIPAYKQHAKENMAPIETIYLAQS